MEADKSEEQQNGFGPADSCRVIYWHAPDFPELIYSWEVLNMKNLMKKILGKDYSKNLVRNFCLYRLKMLRTNPGYGETEEEHAAYDAWRAANDLDCLYFDGDLRADTLMSQWTLIKWVAEYLNRDKGLKLYTNETSFVLLAVETDKYLPLENNLVQLLYEFLAWAELPCNYILLPDRNMNNDRYSFKRGERLILFYDQVPATLWNLFEKEFLGQYFLDENGNVDEAKVTEWVRREKLEMGFEKKIIKQSAVIPLAKEISARRGKELTKESELREALLYDIRFLKRRDRALKMNKATDKAVAQLNKIFEVTGPYGGMIKTDKPCVYWTFCCEIYEETETAKTMVLYESGGDYFDYVIDPWFFVTVKFEGGKAVDVTIEEFKEWNGFGYEIVDKDGFRYGPICKSKEPVSLRSLFSEFMNDICEIGPYLTSPKSVYRCNKDGDMKKVRFKKNNKNDKE